MGSFFKAVGLFLIVTYVAACSPTYRLSNGDTFTPRQLTFGEMVEVASGRGGNAPYLGEAKYNPYCNTRLYEGAVDMPTSTPLEGGGYIIQMPRVQDMPNTYVRAYSLYVQCALIESGDVYYFDGAEVWNMQQYVALYRADEAACVYFRDAGQWEVIRQWGLGHRNRRDVIAPSGQERFAFLGPCLRQHVYAN